MNKHFFMETLPDNETLNMANNFFHNLLKTLVDVYNFTSEDALKLISFKSYILNNIFKGNIIPLLSRIIDLKYFEINELLKEAQSGKNEIDLMNYIFNLFEKFQSGARYDFLINNLGKELFGSAKFENEKLLAENKFFTLTFIPAKKQNNKNIALFHVGGMLPYSDRVFRLLPEVNFFAPFLENGINVYAMEIKGEIGTNPILKDLTLTKMIETIHSFTDIAFAHNNNNKLILEGYCGLAMPSVCAFLADRINMEKKIGLITLFVAPIDGRKCEKLNLMINSMPKSFVFLFFLLSSLLDSPIPGTNIGSSIDMVTANLIDKSIFGRFINGWKSKKYSNVYSISDLDNSMRLELAGAYWISPDNAKRFPVPVSLTNFSTMLFSIGISDEGDIPFKYKGEKLNLNDFKKSNMPIIGFYGADDPLITQNTAEILQKLLGSLYTHIVHQKTGHISYVFSQNRWNENNEKGFKPGIISTIFEKFKN